MKKDSELHSGSEHSNTSHQRLEEYRNSEERRGRKKIDCRRDQGEVGEETGRVVVDDRQLLQSTVHSPQFTVHTKIDLLLGTKVQE